MRRRIIDREAFSGVHHLTQRDRGSRLPSQAVIKPPALSDASQERPSLHPVSRVPEVEPNGKGSINLRGHRHGRRKPVPREFDVGVDVKGCGRFLSNTLSPLGSNARIRRPGVAP